MSSPHYFWVLFAEFCWEDEVKSILQHKYFLAEPVSCCCNVVFLYGSCSCPPHLTRGLKSTLFSCRQDLPSGAVRSLLWGFSVPIGTLNLTTSLQESVLKEKSNNGCSSRAVKRQRRRVWPALLWWSRDQLILTRSSQLLLGAITTLSQWLPWCCWVYATISYCSNVKLNVKLMLQICRR